MGLVTLSLQRMGPLLINELSYNGKKAGASEGAQRPHTAWPSIAPEGQREREDSGESYLPSISDTPPTA